MINLFEFLVDCFAAAAATREFLSEHLPAVFTVAATVVLAALVIR